MIDTYQCHLLHLKINQGLPCRVVHCWSWELSAFFPTRGADALAFALNFEKRCAHRSGVLFCPMWQQQLGWDHTQDDYPRMTYLMKLVQQTSRLHCALPARDLLATGCVPSSASLHCSEPSRIYAGANLVGSCQVSNCMTFQLGISTRLVVVVVVRMWFPCLTVNW